MHESRHKAMNEGVMFQVRESNVPSKRRRTLGLCMPRRNQSIMESNVWYSFFVFFNLFTKVLNSYKPYSYTSRVPYYCEFDQSTRPVFHITSNRRSCILLQVEVQKAISLNLILKGTMLAVCYSVLQCAAPRCHQPILESKVCYTFFYRPLFHKQVLHP